MIQDIKNTVKQSAIYGLSRVSFKLIAFILFPLYSIYFSVDQYGIIVRGEIFWQLIFTTMIYATETALIRWYFLTEESKRKSLIFTQFSFVSVINLALVIISIIFSSSIAFLIFNADGFKNLVIYCALISLSETILGVPLIILRIKEKAFIYSISVIGETLLSLVLQLYFIFYTNNKLEGIFISKIIASFIVVLALSPVLIKNIQLKINYTLLKEITIFCFPLMLASLVSYLFISQDRFILGYMVGSAEVGLYGLGSNIAGFITFVLISPFALAFPQVFWRKVKDENAGRFFTKSMTYSFLIFVYGALFLSIISPYFIKVFALNPDYWAAKGIIPIKSFSLVFNGMQVVGLMSFYYYKKTSVVLYFLIISNILNVILNILFISYWGMYGAAFATLASYVFSSFLMYVWSKKYYFIKWENYKMTIAFIFGVLLTIPFYTISQTNKIQYLFFAIIALLIYPVILYLFKFFEEAEILVFKKVIRRFTNR
ncbi:MAG: hypothetical protein EHM58_07005 [Ignavibacteriae bacterium]|nr:MAG: hypothetical protein EHM58_07005 [Ignavibacteriota bacterium]